MTSGLGVGNCRVCVDTGYVRRAVAGGPVCFLSVHQLLHRLYTVMYFNPLYVVSRWVSTLTIHFQLVNMLKLVVNFTVAPGGIECARLLKLRLFKMDNFHMRKGNIWLPHVENVSFNCSRSDLIGTCRRNNRNNNNNDTPKAKIHNDNRQRQAKLTPATTIFDASMSKMVRPSQPRKLANYSGR